MESLVKVVPTTCQIKCVFILSTLEIHWSPTSSSTAARNYPASAGTATPELRTVLLGADLYVPGGSSGSRAVRRGYCREQRYGLQL